MENVICSMKNILTEERLSICLKDREHIRSDGLKNAGNILGEAAAAEFLELYRLYDEQYYLWLASLWQPEIGGFYYSVSGRDTLGMLPDIESTVQAMRFAGRSGLLSATKDSEHHKKIYENVWIYTNLCGIVCS